MMARKIGFLFFVMICSVLAGCQTKKTQYKTTGYVESKLFIVSSPVGGYLKKLFVHEGQTLAKGDKIVTLEGQSSINAPADSTVMEVLYQREEYVLPNDSIVSLSLPKNLRIIFYVPEQDLQKVSLGKEIDILIDQRKYKAKISYISVQAEYTPDSLFNDKNRYQLVYKIKAVAHTPILKKILKIGQPVDVFYE